MPSRPTRRGDLATPHHGRQCWISSHTGGSLCPKHQSTTAEVVTPDRPLFDYPALPLAGFRARFSGVDPDQPHRTPEPPLRLGHGAPAGNDSPS
jgi:hypothetical protein